MKTQHRLNQIKSLVQRAQAMHKPVFIGADELQIFFECLEAAERERDELRESLAVMNGRLSASRDLKQLCKHLAWDAEEEIARRDAAAGEPVLYALRFKKMQGEPEKEINDNCLFSSYEKARAYGRGGNYVRQDSGKIEWVPNAALDPEVIPLYTAAPPAVLPDIDKYTHGLWPHAVEQLIRFRDDALALGAQPQKPVVLPRVRTLLYEDGCPDIFDANKIKAALDAANIPYEVKP